MSGRTPVLVVALALSLVLPSVGSAVAQDEVATSAQMPFGDYRSAIVAFDASTEVSSDGFPTFEEALALREAASDRIVGERERLAVVAPEDCYTEAHDSLLAYLETAEAVYRDTQRLISEADSVMGMLPFILAMHEAVRAEHPEAYVEDSDDLSGYRIDRLAMLDRLSMCEPVVEAPTANASELEAVSAVEQERTRLGALPAEAANAKVVSSGPRSSGAVALTFDDGLLRSNCSKVAKTLRAHNVKATFFINGAHLKRQPKQWRRILKGMPVGNHTRSHRNLVRESSRVVRAQIHHNEAIHEKVLRRPMLKVLRPPYGSYDHRVRRIAGQLGYRRTVLWNVTAADTSSKATVRSVIRRTTGARPGSIILMHCHKDITVEALPSIIRHYKKRGIRMVGLGELLGI